MNWVFDKALNFDDLLVGELGIQAVDCHVIVDGDSRKVWVFRLE